MKKPKLLIVLSLLVLLILSCGLQGDQTGLQGTIDVQNTNIAAITQDSTQATSTPQSITSTPNNEEASQTQTNQELCQSDKMSIIPVSVFQHLIGDGWKIVIIDLAIANGSSLTYSQVYTEKMTLTTEGGFVYEPINLDISEGLLEGYTYATGGLADNSLFVRNIPPGFIIRGDNQFGWKLDVRTMHYGYMVAESQQIFTLQAPEVLIYCFSPSGEQISQKEEGFSLSVDLNLTPITYPLVQVDNGFQNILESEITLEKGRVQFTNVERSHIVWEDVGIESDVMFLYYKYANASQGYDALEFFIGYVVGDDGIARHLGCPSNCVSSTGLQANITGLAAGPGQTVEGVFAFTISNEVSNLKLVFESVQQVFNVPIE